MTEIDLIAALRQVVENARRARQMEDTVRQVQAVINGPDTDTRCPHHTPAGQCLDHQGHLGDHQYPQETR